MKPEDKVKLFYMANLYYMAGGNLPKKKYANGSMVMPNQMQPQMPMMQGPQADLSTTKQLTSIGLNPAIMGATGGLSAAIAPIAGLAIDAWKFNRAMDNSYDVNAMMGEAVKKQQRQASPYNTETGYMQGNFANGGSLPEDPPSGGGWYREKKGAKVFQEGTKDAPPSGEGWIWMDSNPDAPPSEDPSIPAEKPFYDYAKNYSSQTFSDDTPQWNISGTKDPDALRVDTLYQQPGTGVTTKQQASDITNSLLVMGNTTPDFNPYVSANYDYALQQYQNTASGSGTGKAIESNNAGSIPDEVGSSVGSDFLPMNIDGNYKKPLYATNPQAFFDQQNGNFANGGKVPIWKMLGDDPSQFQMDENNNQQGGGESEAYKEGGLSRSKDYGSEKKPYPMVKRKDFAGGNRSYPIPTKADAVDALRLAGLHGRSDVKAKVYAKYPELKHADGGGIGYSIERDAILNNSSAPFYHGGENNTYGIIPGNGNPKADDKNMTAEDGAFIVPADRVPIAKMMLSQMGLNPNKKLNSMHPGAKEGGSPIKISSKEMYLSPDVKESMKLDMGMTDHDLEKTLSPNSPYNQYYTDDYLHHAGPSEWRNQGTNQYVNQDHNVMERQRLSPTLYAMARFADGGGIADWWYNNMRSQQYRDENYSPSEMKAMRKEEEAQLNDPDYSSEREINMRNNQQPTAETPETSTTTGLPEDFKKMNRNLLIANTVGAGGQALYNMMQKYTPMPRPQMYRPEKYTANFGALDEFMNRQIQKVGATSRYNARNVNQIPATNAAIQANQLENQIDRAAKMQQMKNELNYRNTELANQANLLNLQNIQNVNLQDAENRFKFRAMKGQALSGNIESGLKGYRNYVNADFGMKALEQGYKAGQINEQLYRKALNTPDQLTPEEVKRINAITGGNFDPSKLVTPIQENEVIPGTI